MGKCSLADTGEVLVDIRFSSVLLDNVSGVWYILWGLMSCLLACWKSWNLHICLIFNRDVYWKVSSLLSTVPLLLWHDLYYSFCASVKALKLNSDFCTSEFENCYFISIFICTRNLVLVLHFLLEGWLIWLLHHIGQGSRADPIQT